MTLVALVSAKHSPGVTTAAVALATTWPEGRRVIVAECDPAGGDIAARQGIPLEPGITSLAASSRHGFDPTSLATHSQRLPSGREVLVGPSSPDQAAAALSVLAAHVGSVLQDLPNADVLADCGRVDANGPAWPLVMRADVVLLVLQPNLTGVEHARSRLGALDHRHRDIAVLLVGEHPYPAAEVAASLGVEVIGVLADDGAAADALLGGSSGRRVSRSLLLRSARTVGEAICRHLDLAHPAAIDAPRTAQSSGRRVVQR